MTSSMRRPPRSKARELGRKAVGKPALGAADRCTGGRAEGGDGCCVAAVRGNRLAQRPVSRPEIDVTALGWLVLDPVGLELGPRAERHRPPPAGRPRLSRWGFRRKPADPRPQLTRPSSSRRAMTCAWISAAPSKMLRMRASHSTRLTGYSSAKPLPPWICRALSAAAQATRAREQLGHAGLEVAAPALVLLARGEIGELARDHDLDRHHRELVGDAREGDQIGLPNCLRSCGVAQAELEGRTGPRRWRARRSGCGRSRRSRISCLKPWPSTPPSRFVGRHLEAVEAELVFLHAAIAEHLDLAAGHALGREGVAVGAARLRRQQHREAAVVAWSPGSVRTSSVITSARAAWVIQVLLPVTTQSSPSRTARVRSAPRSEPVLGSVKTAVGRISPRGDLRQPVLPSAPRCRRRGSARRRSPSGCRASRRRYSRATAPRRRRTSPSCRRPRAAVLLGDGQAEDAELAHLLDDLDRDVARSSGATRGRRARPRSSAKRRNWSRIISIVSSRPVAPKVAAPRAPRSSAPPAAARRRVAVAAGDQRLDRGGRKRRAPRRATPSVGRPDDLDLAHRDAAGELAEVLAEARSAGSAPRSRRGVPPPRARSAQPADLAQRLGVGRHPGEPVRRVLLGLERRARDPAAAASPAPASRSRAASTSRAGVGRRRHGSSGRRSARSGVSGATGGRRLRSSALLPRRIVRRGIACCGCAEPRRQRRRRSIARATLLR